MHSVTVSQQPPLRLDELLTGGTTTVRRDFPEAGSNNGDDRAPCGAMIGFARVITDYVTFGYLTDVYVLREHQEKGLGSWMIRCLDERLDSWPLLRRFILLTGGKVNVKLYRNTLGAKEASEVFGDEIVIMAKLGPAAPANHHRPGE